MKQLVIAVDFDGTIVKDRYPEIGNFRFGARTVLKWLKQRGHILILNTCRECYCDLVTARELDWYPTHEGGCTLNEAKDFLWSNGIHFDYTNRNAKHLIEQYGDCRKIGADLYLDDKGFFPGWIWVPVVVLWLEFKNRGGNR